MFLFALFAGDARGERMSDIFNGEARSFKAALLKGEEGQEKIKLFDHLGDALFAMGPDAGTDELDEFAAVALFAERFLEAQVESRVVDADDNLGLEFEDLVADGSELAKETGEGEEDVDEAHHLERLHGSDRGDAERS
jgi:hypothetical protein